MDRGPERLSLLQDRGWKAKYDSDGRALVTEFFVPALECATRYDRTTGYFSAGVLTLAARGIEGLVRNDGRMRLVVGCTLEQAEAEAIERGEEARAVLEAQAKGLTLAAANEGERQALELLSWMVARGFLEVRVAIPCTKDRKPCAGTAIFHAKTGLVEDKTGDRIAFSGSLNETPSGWTQNWESFHVFKSWDGGLPHLAAEEESFARLWADKSERCCVLDVPQAMREDLLRFLPGDERLPERLREAATFAVPDTSLDRKPEPPPSLATEDLRRLVWSIVRDGPALPGLGDRVGEATSIVTPWPHQVRAFQRLYGSWPPRLLIADEVGLGKTIEAGLLLRQAWLAGRARRILVLAPKAVLRQWQIELREKFNLNWPIYDGQCLRWYACHANVGSDERKVSKEEWHHEPYVLASSQLMRRADRARALIEDAEPWDLVILDEAHHARRKGGGATKDRAPNQLLGLMQYLRAKTQGLILLTATPMQVNPVEVWDLLDLLGLPPGWSENAFLRFFERASHPNPSNDDFDAMASLFRASEAAYGEPGADVIERCASALGGLSRRRVLKALRSGAKMDLKQLDHEQRRAAIRLMIANTPVSRLVSRHTRELLRRYYEAGKISTRIAQRKVDDAFIDLSAAERQVYERVEHYIAHTYDAASAAERNAVGFVMTVYRRRLASSFAALAATLERRLQGMTASETSVEEDVADHDLDEVIDEEDAIEIEVQVLALEEKDEIRALLADVKKLPRVDTKARELVKIVAALREAGYKKLLVFTQFTDTLDFLREHLIAEGFEVLCFSGRGGELREKAGGWKRIERDEVKRLFRDGSAQILLCTDAAAEGLNFQFCGALVNYDMPWNPMRVEQRIGRIDRLGQRNETIAITNLHYADTVETDVYMALRQRIGLFTRFVGKLQPILAALPRNISEAVLGARDEAQRQEMVRDLEERIRKQEEEGFDLDAVTEADLDEPPRPPALYDLPALDRLIRRPDLLPAGCSVEQLGPGEYKLSMPGMRQGLRVTTSASFFEDHPGSAELWSPGSPLFPSPEDGGAGDSLPAEQIRLLSEVLQSG